MSDTYNGWSNRETWAVALHLDNDEGLHRARCAMLPRGKLVEHDELVRKGVVTADDMRRIRYGREIREWVEGMSEMFYSDPAEWAHLAGMFGDIGSLWRVNWREIAENWIDEYDREAA